MADKPDKGKNRGEWCEFYVFLKILGDKGLYAADKDQKRKSDVFLPVNSVLRFDDGKYCEYIIKDKSVDIRINDEVVAEELIEEIVSQYRDLFPKIINGKGKGAFEIPSASKYMSVLRCTKVKAPSDDKSDIVLDIHEPRTGQDTVQGFSIKSKLNSAATLVNASRSTNLSYVLSGEKMSDSLMDQYNEILSSDIKNKIEVGMQLLKDNGVSFKFFKCDSDTFRDNLTMIDSRMPEMIGRVLLHFYRDRISFVKDIVKKMSDDNFLNHSDSLRKTFYEYKVKRFLISSALGMVPSVQWGGVEETTGGYIIVNTDGEVLCLHLYNRNDFEDYLLNNTKMETPSTGRHGFGSIYKESGEYRIKLNLDVRFKKEE